MWRLFFSTAIAVIILLNLNNICDGLSIPFFPNAGSNQALPPDASPIATPSFDVHVGKCPDVKFDCDNAAVKYYCSSDLACFSWQKCCFYSCSYVCTISSGYRNATTDFTEEEDVES